MSDFSDSVRYAFAQKSIGALDRDQDMETRIKILPGEEFTDANTFARIQNKTSKAIYIDIADIRRGMVKTFCNTPILSEKFKTALRDVHPVKWDNHVTSKWRLEMLEKQEDIMRCKVTHICLSGYHIKPTYFARMGDDGLGDTCYKLEYKADACPKLDDNIVHVLTIHYEDGREKNFSGCFISERNSGIIYQIRTISCTLRCFNEVKVGDTLPKLPWEKIENPKKPTLLVIQDWKMDLSKCQINIKTCRNTSRNLGDPIIYFKIELTENDDFESISTHPIIYLEYPEGKYTFQTNKTIIEKTKTIEGTKFVPYQFETRLTKEILT